MFCRKCGNQLSDDAVFCDNCGEKVAVEPINEMVQEQKTMPMQQAASEQTDKPVQEVVQEQKTMPMQQLAPEQTAEPVQEAVAVKQTVPAQEPVMAQQAGTVQQTMQHGNVVRNEIPSPNGGSQSDSAQQSANAKSGERVCDETVSFCENCGNKLSAGDAVCSECGKGVSEERSTRRKGLNLKGFVPKKSLIIAIIAIVLCVAVAAAAFPHAGNFFAKTFQSPGDYLTYVMQKNVDDTASTVAEALDTLGKTEKYGIASEGKVYLETGAKFIETMNNLSGEDLGQYIDWLNSIALTYNVNKKDNNVSVGIGAELNKKNIGSVEVLADAESGNFYVGIPDFNKTFLNAQNTMINTNELDQATKTMDELSKAMPDEKLTKKIVDRYVKCLFKNIGDVNKEKKTVEIDGISQRVISLSAEIDENEVLDMAKAMLKELKNDKELKKIIEDISIATGTDFEDYDAAIDEALNDIDDEKVQEPEVLIKGEVYVSGLGELVGVKFAAEEVEVISYTTVNGSKFGTISEVKVNGQSFALKGNGKVSADKYTGDFELKALGVPVIDIKTEKLNMKKFGEGVFEGKVTVSVNESVTEIMGVIPRSYMSEVTDVLDLLSNFTIILESKEASLAGANGKVTIMQDGELFASMSVESKTQKGSKVSMPKKSVSVNDSGAITQWVKDTDFDKLCKKLREANVPDKYVDMIESAIDTAA